MKNGNNGKLRATSKAAIWGAALFGGLYLLVLAVTALWSQPHEGSDAASLLVSIIPELIRQEVGLGRNPSSFANTVAFETVINSLFGGLLFFTISGVWQLLQKHENEKNM